MKIKTRSGSHETQREWVYHRIRLDLMAGRYQPGEKVTIAQLTDSLGVSMTPVREALRRLAAERALVMTPNRSVVVPQLSLEDVLAVRLIREQLEGFTARLAARRISDVQLARLTRMGKALEAARARGDARRIMLLNEKFHFTLYEAAGIRVLTEIIATLWLQSAPTLNLLFRPENIGRYPLSEQNRHNQALLRALRVRDGRAAARAVTAEVAVGSRLLERLMPPGGRARI
jgi:DNA-binding GntR family transcriptional regulator